MSVEPLLAMMSHRLSERFPLAMVLTRLLNMILANTLPAMESKGILLELEQLDGVAKTL